MSLRQRGQEATIRLSVDGEIQEGSFFNVTDLEITPRTDLNEEDYIGELESDIDIQHHGFDGSFSVHDEDESVLNFLSLIINREQTRGRHPDITLTVIWAYRESGAADQAEVYHDVFMKVASRSVASRKEYVTSSFELKCKKRSQIAL